MSDTIPDVTATRDAYVNINTLTSLSAGTALVIENKSTSPALLQISATQPDDDSADGSIIFEAGGNEAIKLITAGENTIWAKSIGSVNAILSVQDNS